MKTRTFALASSAVIAMLVLAGCSVSNNMPGTDNRSNPMSNGDTDGDTYNHADVAFTMMMIPHHQQAIDMADLLLAKDGIDEQVRELAARIKDAQGPEIEEMTSWLESWGQDTDMGGMNHGGMMMGDDDMAALEAASGSNASRLFLEQMIVHHQGAIAMAQDEIADGKNAGATTLADKIVVDQTAEIQTMQNLLVTI